jgi:aryl-alcohol dehydrogenase-like predicted oxidoreductase
VSFQRRPEKRMIASTLSPYSTKKTISARERNNMQQRKLGKDGPMVGAIGLGTNPMASFTERPSYEEAVRLLVHAAEQGMTLWDAADAYCLDDTDIGYSEWICRDARNSLPSDLRDQVVIATKGGTVRPEGGWEQDCSPEHLRDAIDASLKALQTETIELYQMHRPDAKVPFADSIGALALARQQGKIRHVGLSNVDGAQIEEAVAIVPIASVQNSYSLSNRRPETDGSLAKCRELGIAFLPFSPLGGVKGAKAVGGSGAIGEIAGELGVSPQQVALAWLLEQYEMMIPIPGVTRVESIDDDVRAATVTLSPEQLARLADATL